MAVKTSNKAFESAMKLEMTAIELKARRTYSGGENIDVPAYHGGKGGLTCIHNSHVTGAPPLWGPRRLT